MDYQEADKIRKKSFGTLLGEQEGGLGSSLKSAISQKTQAKVAGIKETFDPMNMARAVGGKTGAAIYGKMFNRDQSSMERFAGAKKKKTVSDSTSGGDLSEASTPSDVLGLIYRLMLRADEEKKTQEAEDLQKKKTDEDEENDRNEQIIKAITGRSKKKPTRKEKAKEKKEEVKAKKETKKEEGKKPPTEEKKAPPTEKGKKPSAEKAPKEAPKEAAKPPPKETPKETPKVPAKEAPKPTAKEAPKESPKAPKTSEKVPTKEAPKTAEKVSPKAPPSIGVGQGVKEMIKQHEGNIPFPYKDSKGLWTIGVGHLIGDGKSLPPQYEAWKNNGGPYDKKNNTTPAMTPSEVDALFEKDFESHKQMAIKTPGWDKANESGQAAMIDLAYNMGGSWYKSWPSTAKALESGDFNKAADGLKDSKWYTQVKGRAVKIVDMIRNGGKESSPGVPTNQALPAMLSQPTGTKIDQASKENKDLKQAIPSDASAQTINSTTNVKQQSSSSTPTQSGDDRNAYLKKAQG